MPPKKIVSNTSRKPSDYLTTDVNGTVGHRCEQSESYKKGKEIYLTQGIAALRLSGYNYNPYVDYGPNSCDSNGKPIDGFCALF